jgi:hypothetical protein
MIRGSGRLSRRQRRRRPVQDPATTVPSAGVAATDALVPAPTEAPGAATADAPGAAPAETALAIVAAPTEVVGAGGYRPHGRRR